MKQIPLSKGQVALVDDWWFEELNKYKWHASWNPNTRSYYATRMPSQGVVISMHAVIAGTPKGLHTDHVDHNTLDNQEHNLRVCTRSENQHNKDKYSNNTSGFKGVHRNRKKWIAQIGINGRLLHIGSYSTPEEAARAYDEAAKKLHGKFARLNFCT